jgi:hypothetical protein
MLHMATHEVHPILGHVDLCPPDYFDFETSKTTSVVNDDVRKLAVLSSHR